MPARDSVYTPGCKGCKVGGEIAQQSLSDPRGGENKDENKRFNFNPPSINMECLFI